ncbi:MAG TPA: 1-acyl-sn-glycerol-3-phosphate acyltransferase [Anaerolineales bacterium]|nr:1-acyl-sn-glycerol-3-phosphate acyltransferase [Anaerolineales bacterium]
MQKPQDVAQPFPYRVVCRLARLLLDLFYRRVEVVGLDRIPAGGPVIVAANHQNGLVDPMFLLGMIPRRLTPIAKAPLFRHPLIGSFLRLAGAIPVHRRQDDGSDMTRNREMFGAAIATLKQRGALLIFPEGLSQAEPVLMPLRTGAARILLSAETEANGGLGVTLLPVGLVFHDPGSFRTGWALTLVGPPVPTDDLIRLYRTSPEAAVRQLTDRVTEALRRQIVEAQDRQMLRLVDVVTSLLREESVVADADLVARAKRSQQVMRAYGYLISRQPERLEALRIQVEQYADDLDLVGMTGRQLDQTYPAGVVWRYTIREGLPLLLGLPLALWGIMNHLIPYQLTAMVVRLIDPPPAVEATYKLSAGLVLYPLCWAGQGWLAWRIGGGWLLALFLASLIPTGFFALTWHGRLWRFRREARGYLQFLKNRDLRHRLIDRRRVILEEVSALSRLVPESVLE